MNQDNTNQDLDYSQIQPYVKKDARDVVVEYLAEKQYGLAKIPYHVHNGVDTDHVSYTDIIKRNVYVQALLKNTEGQTAGNYGVFWIAPFACNLSLAKCVFSTASTSGTVMVEKLTGTTAPGSGTSMLSSAMSTSGTANTIVAGSLSTTLSSTQIAAGDRIAIKNGGTLTNLVGLCVIIELTY